RAPRMAEEQVIDVGHERRALATRRDVTHAEIRNHRHSDAFRDYCRFADLHRVGAAFVIDRLAVAADQLHWSESRDGALDCARIELAELEVQPRDRRSGG